MIPIIDLHCDLLLYLAEKEGRSFDAPEARCSFPQLQKGGVDLQVLAIYTATKKGSYARACRQIKKFRTLKTPFCKFIAAVENASGLLEEEEDSALLPSRLKALQNDVGSPLYISLTWNSENRFAGGNETHVGLKEDGKALLEEMSGRQIAIDLSHTSDETAVDIFNTIDKKNLKITPIASHSNFRSITNAPRNLPDEMALEIVKRGGVIGLNCVRKFVGEDFKSDFVRMILHARRLGILDHLCFGADFFYDGDSPNRDPLAPFFHEEFGNSSCYPKLLDLLKEKFSDFEIQGIANRNALQFLQGTKK
jgi:membrane dipeptidase